MRAVAIIGLLAAIGLLVPELGVVIGVALAGWIHWTWRRA